MDVRRVKANDNVVDDRGKLALERGPVMSWDIEGKRPERQYGVQQIYHGEHTREPAVWQDTAEQRDQTLTGATPRKWEKDGTVDVDFCWPSLPTWNNRGADQDGVDSPAAGGSGTDPRTDDSQQRHASTDHPGPDTKDAPESASMETEFTARNDQLEPCNSADISNLTTTGGWRTARKRRSPTSLTSPTRYPTYCGVLARLRPVRRQLPEYRRG